MLLLNAGASILTVQALLGHRRIDAALGYARLHEDTEVFSLKINHSNRKVTCFRQPV
jgi:site-specific recombinase XerD